MADESCDCGNDMTTCESLDGLCDYVGPADDLPVGGYCKIPFWDPSKAAFRWKVQDAEEEVGWKLVKASELTAESMIIGVVMNQNTIAEIVAQYGENFIQIRDANGGPFMIPKDWKAKFGTDGVALLALRNKRLELQGPGVNAHPYQPLHYGVVAYKPLGSGTVKIYLNNGAKPVKLGKY